MEKQLKTWSEYAQHLDTLPSDIAKLQFIEHEFIKALNEVSSLREDRNVILYGSGWMQKSVPSSFVSITSEEINGLMAVVHGLDCSKGLTLILHTPGGVAPDALVDYIRQKFPYFEVIVPTLAMSAGTMICLGSDRIIMGKQSQLGPIDPQMGFNGRSVSAFSILDQFEYAQKQIQSQPILAHSWAPILAQYAPALLTEANNVIQFSETMVTTWLSDYMFAGDVTKAQRACQHFSRGSIPGHRNHGRRINRTEARDQGLTIEDLETSQALQDAVMKSYHLMTILFEKTSATKIFFNHNGSRWVKNATQ